MTLLTNLVALDLSGNFLDVPPEFRVGTLKKLRSLDLSKNRLRSLPLEVSFLHALEELKIDRNCLQAIPTEICKLEALRTFTCWGNPFVIEEHTRLSRSGLAEIRAALGWGATGTKGSMSPMSPDQRHRLLQQRADRKKGVRKRNAKSQEMKGRLSNSAEDARDMYNTRSRIKRGRLTRTWDLRPYYTSSKAHRGGDELPVVLFSNCTGIREAVMWIEQLPSLVSAGGSGSNFDLPSAWRLLYGMRDLVTLWVFDRGGFGVGEAVLGDDDEALVARQRQGAAKRLSVISRGLSLVFEIVNQSLGHRRREPQSGWRFTVFFRDAEANF